MKFTLVDAVTMPGTVLGLQSKWWKFCVINPKHPAEYAPGLQFLMSYAEWIRRGRPAEIDIPIPELAVSEP